MTGDLLFWVLSAFLTAGLTLALLMPLKAGRRLLKAALMIGLPLTALGLYFLCGAANLLP